MKPQLLIQHSDNDVVTFYCRTDNETMKVYATKIENIPWSQMDIYNALGFESLKVRRWFGNFVLSDFKIWFTRILV